MADRKIEYGSSVEITCTLANLAESSDRTTGRESDLVDNSSNKYLDFLLAGKITTGTSPTSGEHIEVWVWGQLDDTPSYPDGITGSDAAFSFSSTNIRNSGFKLAWSTAIDSTNDETYWMPPISIADLFGGNIPKKWGVIVTQSSDANLNNTASNQKLWYTPIYETVV